MASTELKAPKTINDLRYKHLSAFCTDSFKEKGGDPDPQTIVEFISLFFGIMEPMVLRMEYNDLQKVYRHCVNLWAGFGLERLPKTITVNGKEYDLVNLKRPSTGWVIDSIHSDFDKDPARLACICYVPKGTKYGDIDQNSNLLHPISDRHAEFKEHFELKLHAHLSAFFLKRYVVYAKRYMAVQSMKRWSKNLKQAFKRGGKRLTWWRKNTA